MTADDVTFASGGAELPGRVCPRGDRLIRFYERSGFARSAYLLRPERATEN